MAAMTIRVMGKWSVQSSVIFGYSRFNRRQIKNMMDSREGNVGCVTVLRQIL